MDTALEFLTNYWLWCAIAIGAIVVLAVLILIIKKMSRPKKTGKKSRPRPAVEIGKQTQVAESDYEMITERIVKLGDQCKSVLFASGGPASLPITIPVNAAIDLAKNKGKKCLLIDLDVKRNAAAKVFNIAGNIPIKEVHPRAYDTEIKDLQIWPADNFRKSKQMNIKSLVASASKKYDIVLVNAPHLNSSPDRRPIASSADYGFVFSNSSEEAGAITSLIEEGNCTPIGNMHVKEI